MIVTYPLDNYQFDAADAAGYFSTRQSGVYSAEEDFAVTASGGTSVTVAPGRAWIHPDRWTGYSVLCRDPQTVELPTADGARTRLDRIVLRYDAAARKTRLLVLPGEPDSASPTPPEITRTGLVYDLGLALVTRKAGSTAITSADLTDTRADEAVCGVMRDGVTGIPTAQLQAQALAMMTQLSTELHTKLAALDAAIASVESGSFYTKSEADAKFGTPYSLPPAAADQLGGVKVGDYLDIAPDGTLSGKTLYDTIAASVAVKSEARLVWNTHVTSPNKFTTWDVQIPGNVDKICITKGKYNSYNNNTEKSIARGGTTTYDCDYNFTITFQTNGILHVVYPYKTVFPLELWIDGYHYPTLAELVAETQASQADTDALAVDQEYRVAMLELGLTDDTTTDTSTT